MRRDCGWSHPLEVKSFSLYVESVLLALQTRFDQSILASEAIRQCIPAQVFCATVSIYYRGEEHVQGLERLRTD